MHQIEKCISKQRNILWLDCWKERTNFCIILTKWNYLLYFYQIWIQTIGRGWRLKTVGTRFSCETTGITRSYTWCRQPMARSLSTHWMAITRGTKAWKLHANSMKLPQQCVMFFLLNLCDFSWLHSKITYETY